MNKGRTARTLMVGCALMGLLFLGGVMWLAFRYPGTGPIHDGKRLSVWVDDYREHLTGGGKSVGSETRWRKATNAIHAIGTNGLPTLVGMVGAMDSAFKTRVVAVLGKQKFIKLKFQPASSYRAKATYGLGVLGPTAEPAVPALIGLLSDPDRDVRASAAHCLSLIGPEAVEAVPHLVKLLHDTGNGYGPIVLNAMHALGSIHADPETVVPLLLEYIDGPRKGWRYGAPALDALRRYRTEAKAAVPAILPLVNDPDESVRRSAANALDWIDPETASPSQAR